MTTKQCESVHCIDRHEALHTVHLDRIPLDLIHRADVCVHTAENNIYGCEPELGGVTEICFVVAVISGVNWCALVIEDF